MRLGVRGVQWRSGWGGMRSADRRALRGWLRLHDVHPDRQGGSRAGSRALPQGDWLPRSRSARREPTLRSYPAAAAAPSGYQSRRRSGALGPTVRRSAWRITQTEGAARNRFARVPAPQHVGSSRALVIQPPCDIAPRCRTTAARTAFAGAKRSDRPTECRDGEAPKTVARCRAATETDNPPLPLRPLWSNR